MRRTPASESCLSGVLAVLLGFSRNCPNSQFPSVTVSVLLGDFVDEAKLHVLSTWNRWGSTFSVGWCLFSYYRVTPFSGQSPLCPLPWAHPFGFMPRILPLPEFPKAWPGLFICGFLKHMAIKCLLPG